MLRRALVIGLLALSATPAFAASSTPLAQPAVSAGDLYRLSVIRGSRIVETHDLVVPNGGDAQVEDTRAYAYRATASITTFADPRRAPVKEERLDQVRVGTRITLVRANDIVQVSLSHTALIDLSGTETEAGILDRPDARTTQLLQTARLRTGESVSWAPTALAADVMGGVLSATAFTLTRVGPVGPAFTAVSAGDQAVAVALVR